jgi:hypothetical protein
MKNLFIAAVMAVSITTGLSSCSKCEICTKDSEPETRICENDYDSNTEYGLALDFKEADGYECK